MHAVTIDQPHASLIAASVATYLVPLTFAAKDHKQVAVCSGWRWTREHLAECRDEYTRSVLEDAGFSIPNADLSAVPGFPHRVSLVRPLPLAAVVCIAEVVSCRASSSSPGRCDRFLWELSTVRLFRRPIPIRIPRGRPCVFECQLPDYAYFSHRARRHRRTDAAT